MYVHVDNSFTISDFSMQSKKKISLVLLQETVIMLQGMIVDAC